MFEFKVPLASRSDRRTTRPSGLPSLSLAFKVHGEHVALWDISETTRPWVGRPYAQAIVIRRMYTYMYVDVHEGHGHRNSQAVRKLVLCYIEGRARHLLPAWGGARAGAAAASGGSCACCAHMGVMSFSTRCVAKGPCSQGLPKRRLTRPPPCPRPSSHLGRAWASGASR